MHKSAKAGSSFVALLYIRHSSSARLRKQQLSRVALSEPESTEGEQFCKWLGVAGHPPPATQLRAWGRSCASYRRVHSLH
jgi:hypothetical protein